MTVAVSKNLIYGLIDPRNGQLRYVGQSSVGMRRALKHLHINTIKTDDSHKGRWVRSVVSEGVTPEIFVIEYCASSDVLDDSEIFWIAYFKSIGCQLTNLTNGGAGIHGYHHTPEAKAAIGRKNKGLVRTPEQRLRVSQAYRPRVLSPETRALLAIPGRRSHSREEGIKTSRSHGGTTFTDQYGTVYQTVVEAAEKLNLYISGISRVLNGKQSVVGGYVFKRIGTRKEIRPRTPDELAKMSQSKRLLNQDPAYRIRTSRARGGFPFVDQHGTVYQTQAEAARILGIGTPLISRALSGELPHTHGYVFKRLEVPKKDSDDV